MKSTNWLPDKLLGILSGFKISFQFSHQTLIWGGALCLLTGLLAAGVTYRLFDFNLLLTLPSHSICPFKVLTGYPCPGCGMFRALVCLVQLRIADAMSYHPFALLVLPGLIGVVFPDFGLQKLFTEKIAVLFLVLLILFWLVRLSDLQPFLLSLYPV